MSDSGLSYSPAAAGKLIRKLLFRKNYVKVAGSTIAAPDQRWCGPEFKDSDFYLASAEREAQRLIDDFSCSRDSRVLDIGCGQGRLPIGILRVIGELDYTGIDIDRKSIEWCKRYIQRDHPSFRFKHLSVYNERYNQRGVKLDEDFRFDLETDSMDVAYLYSVFSHTTEADMRIYLSELGRVLADNGMVFFTTFVEQDVADISINPKNHRLKCSGPLHVVQYRKDYLFGLLEESGYDVVKFSYATEADGQSAICLSKKGGERARTT